MVRDFHDVLTALTAGGVRFLIVGAHALAAHGVPRVTGDLDIWVEPSQGNAANVWRSLLAFGAPLNALGVNETDFATANRVVQLGVPPYRIDLMTSISGVDFADAWAARMAGTLFEVPVAYLGRDQFIRNKRASGRPKDLRDIESLGD